MDWTCSARGVNVNIQKIIWESIRGRERSIDIKQTGWKLLLSVRFTEGYENGLTEQRPVVGCCEDNHLPRSMK